MTDVTDEMVSAALRVWATPQEDERLHPSQHFRRAIAAALAAAPAVEGWEVCTVYGEDRAHVFKDGDPSHFVEYEHDTGEREPMPCPGPHRTLLLGPEVSR